jgi:hypothetical protein
MSMIYCHVCDKNIDTDFNAEHFEDNHAVKEIKEPTKADVWEIADRLGCTRNELWSEVSKLLHRQHEYTLFTFKEEL